MLRSLVGSEMCIRDRSLSNTMWPGPRPTCMPSFILIHPTVWPQYTNVTDRQTDRTGRQDRRGQRSDSIGRTVLQTVAQTLILKRRLRSRNMRSGVFDHRRCRSDTWICTCGHTPQLYMPSIINIRSGVLEPPDRGSKFGHSHYFGCWLLHTGLYYSASRDCFPAKWDGSVS